MNIPAPFSENQKQFFDRCFHSWFNVAEGGKRGGKNVLITMAYCTILEKHPSRLHLIAGVSTATARINILDCDGFGMLNFFEGRCRSGQYQNRDCLYINTPTGEKVVLISGGGKLGDEKLIKGNTYGTAYITEANECSQVFIQEVFDRTLSSPDRKIFHDLNPKAQSHWYYPDVLSFHEEQQKLDPEYGYNYGHFTIADNMSVSDEQLRARLKTYDKKSVWYARDILGLRKTAEGLIYLLFANDEKRYMIPRSQVPKLSYIEIGADVGGNKSKHAYVAAGYTADETVMYVLKAMSYQATGVTVTKYREKLLRFADSIKSEYGFVDTIWPDNAEAAIVNELQAHCDYDIRGCIKGEIIDRIRCADALFSQDRIKIVEGQCEDLCDGLRTAVWDEKHDDKPLDDGTYDRDVIDAFDYSMTPHIVQLLRG